MANFIDKTFREEYGKVLEEFGFDSNKQVRSVESCRVDLLKWGAKFEKNTNIFRISKGMSVRMS